MSPHERPVFAQYDPVFGPAVGRDRAGRGGGGRVSEVILALDPGTATGWACSLGPRGVKSFTVHDRVSHDVRHGRLGWRWAGWLGDVITEYGPSVVVIEEMLARDHRGSAAQVLLGLRMIALAQCYARELVVEEVNQSTWKAWARRHMPEWQKGDREDAAAILAYWQAVRAPLVFHDARPGVAA